MEKISIGIGVSSIGRFLPLIGKAAGFFDRENLDVEIVNQQDEEKVVEDLATQKVPIGTPNAPSLLFSFLDGNDLVIVGGVLNRPAFYLTANESIHRIADLKGKRVGINQPRRMAGIVMLALLRKWGLDTHRDLTLVDFGLNDRSLEAVKKGELAAALLPPEKAFEIAGDGFRVIADSSELECHWVPLATTRSFLAGNRDLVRKIRSIYIESIRLFKNDPPAALKEIRRWLPALESKPESLKKCYDVFAERFESTLMPSLSSLDSILREVARQDARARNIQIAALVDNLE